LDLKFDVNGLVPAVIQDSQSLTVLMVGWMNQEAISKTQNTGEVHFWSRSRQSLWRKGETSGNVLQVKGIWLDCDRDTLLVKVVPQGPVCHTGAESCFFTKY